MVDIKITIQILDDNIALSLTLRFYFKGFTTYQI